MHRNIVNRIMMMVSAIITLSVSAHTKAGPILDQAKEKAGEVVEAGKEAGLDYLDQGSEWATGVSMRFVSHLIAFVTEGKVLRVDNYTGEAWTMLGILFFSITFIRLRKPHEGKPEEDPSWMIFMTSLGLAWLMTAFFEAINTWPDYHVGAKNVHYAVWILVPIALFVRWRIFKNLRLALKAKAPGNWFRTLESPLKKGPKASPNRVIQVLPEMVEPAPKPVTTHCKKCRTPLKPGKKFCGKCGTKNG